MSDWNTLHLFDSKRFNKEILPEIIEGGPMIETFLKSKLYWYLTRIDKISDELLYGIKEFLKDFDYDLRFHKELFEVESQIEISAQNDREYWKKKRQKTELFRAKYKSEIYHFTSLLPLIMFSECAQFNPHLILGRWMFNSNILTTPGSIAKEACDAMTDMRMAVIGHSDIGHVMNWLTFEEVRMLWLDIHNVNPKTEDARQYYDDFVKFIRIAMERKLGFISVSNIREDVMTLIEKPNLEISIDLKEEGFASVIRYERKV